MPQFTVAEAARAVSVDRATLYRYIKLGKLSLTRDEKGKRGVDAAELARVFPAVSQNVAPATAEHVDLLQERLKAAEKKECAATAATEHCYSTGSMDATTNRRSVTAPAATTTPRNYRADC